MNNNNLNEHDIVRAILRGNWDEDQLRMFSDALRHTYKMGRQQRLVDAQTSLRSGQTVTLKGIRPRRLIGVTGTLENFRIGATRADVRVIDANWNARYHRGDLIRGVPLICLDITPSTFGAPAKEGPTIKGKVGAGVKLAALKRAKDARNEATARRYARPVRRTR
jgi:hypothetical protein